MMIREVDRNVSINQTWDTSMIGTWSVLKPSESRRENLCEPEQFSISFNTFYDYIQSNSNRAGFLDQESYGTINTDEIENQMMEYEEEPSSDFAQVPV